MKNTQTKKLNQSLNDQIRVFKKVDKIYFKSVMASINDSKSEIRYEMVRMALIIIFLIINYMKMAIDATFFVFISSIVFGLTVYLIENIYLKYIQVFSIFMEIAEKTGHIVEVPIMNNDNSQNIQNLIADVYNCRDEINSENVINQIEEDRLKSLVKNIYYEKRKLQRFLVTFFNFLSFGIVIFFIVQLSLHNYDQPMYGFVIWYVIMEGMNRLKIILLIAILLLCSPILCCLCIFYLAFKKPNNAQSYSKKLQPVKYTPTMNLNYDHVCSICRQAYEEQESLVILQCKHNFHEECIKHWFKVGATCPVCRLDFTKK